MVRDYQIVANVIEWRIVVVSEILEKSAELFRKARHENTLGSWRGYVDALVKLTLELSDRKRQELLGEAARRREELSNPNEERYLWFFSHGSDTIFEKFLSEYTGLHYPFAEFLLKINRQNVEGERVGELNQKFFKYFTEWYASLLSSSGYKYFFLLPDSGWAPRISLIPTPLSTPESIARVTREHRLEIAPQEVEEYLAMYCLPPCLTNMPDEQRAALENAVAENVEMDDVYEWDAPQEWRRTKELAGVLGGAIADGKWPTFVMQPRPTLDATQVETCWIHPVRGIAEIAARYLSQETVSLLVRLGTVTDGRLPVGLKVHCLKPDGLNADLFYKKSFHLAQANACIVLPPVGSVSATEEMLGMIHKKIGLSFLDNDDFQIQVCSPGELSAKHAAILGICFYLGSDRLRRYDKSDFVTTQNEKTGGRLVVYGAGRLSRNFTWWGKDETGTLCVEAIPSSVKNRTDVLTCSSLLDIDHVNLVATLLVHYQYGGFWAELGNRFVQDFDVLLDVHHLSHLLEVSWIYFREDKSNDATHDRDGIQFFDAFSELMALAFTECDRMKNERSLGENDAAKRGILSEIQALLRLYRAELSTKAAQEIIGGVKWFRSMRISQE